MNPIATAPKEATGRRRLPTNRPTKVLSVITIVLIVVGVTVSWQWGSLVFAYISWGARAATVDLPPCDRIEICQLDGVIDQQAVTGFPVRPSKGISLIRDRTMLEGAAAAALAKLWRSQTFGLEYESLCHTPGYGIRFYHGSTLLLETSVCFRCSNFSMNVQGEPGW